MTSRITRRPWGSGHTYSLDGQRVPGVTSILNNSLPKAALPDWYAKRAAMWAATHRELVDALGEDAWMREASKAPRDEADKAAERGRSVHTHALELLSGETPDVSEDTLLYVEQAARFLDDADAKEILAERPCANTRYRYCGTFDLIAEIGGVTWLLDYKTGSGPFNNHALQLAAYSICDLVQLDPDTDAPMPKIDRCGFVMVRPDGYALIPLTANHERMAQYFLRCMDVAAFYTNTSGQSPKWEWMGEPVLSGATA